MASNSHQVKVTLSDELMDFAQSFAQQYGMTVAGVLKYFLLKKAEEKEYPVFKMSKRSLEAYDDAMKNYDKAIDVTDLDNYFSKFHES